MDKTWGSYLPRPLHREGRRCRRDRSPTLHSYERAARTAPQAALETRVISDIVPHASKALIQTELDSVIGLGGSGQVLTPFVFVLAPIKLPGRFVKPEIRYYDGSTDPKKFLSTYKYTLHNRGCTPEQMCKLFPEYLEGVAKTSLVPYPKEPSRPFEN